MGAEQGQLHNRESRLRQTSDWLGARPVDAMGNNLLPPAADEGIDPLHVARIVNTIRHSLHRGVSLVRVTERMPEIVSAVQAQLTSCELRQVVFDLGQNLPPGENVELADASKISPIAPMPPLVPGPGVIRVEDGTLAMDNDRMP